MHALSSFDEMEIRNSAVAALGELQRHENAEERIEAKKALRSAVMVLLRNQAALAMALGQLKVEMDKAPERPAG